MVVLTEEAEVLRQDIGRALRTTVRDALALLYNKLFPGINPGKTPYQVLTANKKACNVLKDKHFLLKTIKKNKIDKLDVGALCVLLRWACGLSSEDKAWRDLARLEGNIDKLRQLRNADAHWTQEGCSQEKLEHSWQQMVTAVTNVLQMAGLEDHLARVKEELVNIRKPKLEVISDRKEIQGIIQGELQELYSCGRKTTLMPIVWAGRSYSFHHSVEMTYTKTKFSTYQDGMLREVDGESLVEELGSPRMILLQGETGTGKTSLLRHYAAAWAASTLPALTNVDYLIFLDCTAVSTRTFTVGDIIQEILPNTYSKWRPATILKELSKAGSKVMFLIDAFDERLDAFGDAFKNLQRKCSKAFFVVTTRPHCTLAIAKLCEAEPTVVTAHGFSRSSAVDYATKLFKTCGKTVDVEQFFRAISSYDELTTIPQLLCWSSWFWMEEGGEHFSTRGKVFASITDFLLRKLCHISGERILSGELPSKGQRWRSAVARLAFSQAKHNCTVLTESSREIKELLRKAEQLKLPPHEALSSLLQCDSDMTGMGERIVFQFVHESHANFLAAFHIVETLHKSKKTTLSKLMKVLQADRKKSIVSFTVSLMFEKRKSVDIGIIQDIAKMCKPYVRFYDINFHLDLIEESDYKTNLARELAKHMVEDPDSTSSPVSTTTASPTNSFPQLFRYQLWLRPKELRRRRALSMLLSQAKPKRLWLRLSEGPRADEESPVPGRQVVEGDPVAAMRLVSTAYSNSLLLELRLSDLRVEEPLTWPKGLWWLSLERCNIKCDLGLPPDLQKVSLIECTGMRNVKFSPRLKSLKLQSMSLEDVRLPGSVETLVLSGCTFEDLTVLPPAIKYLKLDHCSISGRMTIPESLEHLTVNVFNIIDLKFTKIQQFIIASRGFMMNMRSSISASRNLKSFSITDIALPPEDFMDFFLEFEEEHPGCRLVVQSLWQLKDDCIERDIIVTSVGISSLPEVMVTFQQERITNNDKNS